MIAVTVALGIQFELLAERLRKSIVGIMPLSVMVRTVGDWRDAWRLWPAAIFSNLGPRPVWKLDADSVVFEPARMMLPGVDTDFAARKVGKTWETSVLYVRSTDLARKTLFLWGDLMRENARTDWVDCSLFTYAVEMAGATVQELPAGFVRDWKREPKVLERREVVGVNVS